LSGAVFKKDHGLGNGCLDLVFSPKFAFTLDGSLRVSLIPLISN
jgi:hypothetical protein